MGSKTSGALSSQTNEASPDASLADAIRRYVRACAEQHGMGETSRLLGVSRFTLWRYLKRGRAGRAVSRAVLRIAGGSVEALDTATAQVAAAAVEAPAATAPAPGPAPLPAGERTALRALCIAPLTTAPELSRFTRIPTTTLRGRLTKLAARGLVGAVTHRLDSLGPQPQRRYFSTAAGIRAAAGEAERGLDAFLRTRPVSRRWFRLLAERLDAVAVLYHVAALVADTDPHGEPVRVDHYRQGPYDLLITLTRRRSIGILRQGATLPSAHLRYRLRTMEKLLHDERPTVTLVITSSDQANRRAVRTLDHVLEHRNVFVATERNLLAGGPHAVVWQQCGTGTGTMPPVTIAPAVTLAAVVAWTDRLLEDSDDLAHRYRFPLKQLATPNPATLYPTHLRAALPAPTNQIQSSLAVQLNPADKALLDHLAAWPLATTVNLAGLLGGVTRRRANQLLHSLAQRGLVRAIGTRHVLTDAGLTSLARRDRTAERIALGRWSPRPWRPRPGAARVFAGTSLRALATQLPHQDAVTDFTAALSAAGARSPNHTLVELLPTHRSSIGYVLLGNHYVVHPDATFRLAYNGQSRPYLLEVERRATTPKRAAARLNNYHRYFLSSYAERDHGGIAPVVLFVFETPADEDTFHAAARTEYVPLLTTHRALLGDYGVLGDVWRALTTDTRRRLSLDRLHSRRRLDRPSFSGLPVGGLPTNLFDGVFTPSDPRRRTGSRRVAGSRPRRRHRVPRKRPRPRVGSRRGASAMKRVDTQNRR